MDIVLFIALLVLINAESEINKVSIFSGLYHQEGGWPLEVPSLFQHVHLRRVEGARALALLHTQAHLQVPELPVWQAVLLVHRHVVSEVHGCLQRLSCPGGIRYRSPGIVILSGELSSIKFGFSYSHAQLRCWAVTSFCMKFENKL